jgi:hypothetical protein
LRRVEGSLIGDDSYFDAVRRPAGWPAPGADSWYNAPIGALSCNFNVVTVHVEPSPLLGGRPDLTLEPIASYFQVLNRATTGSQPTAITVDRSFEAGQNGLVVSGTIRRGGGEILVHRAVEEVSTLAGLYPTSFQINLEGDGPSVTADVPRVRRAILHILGYCQRTVSTAEVVSISGRLVQGAYEITIQPRRGTRPDQGARARVQQVVREEASEALERRGRYLSLLVAHGYIAACGGQLRLAASEAGLRSVTCTLPLSRNTT